MKKTEQQDIFEQAIAERSSRRGLCLDLARLDYQLGYGERFFLECGERVLFVGVGHGFDALRALQSGRVSVAVGVDPYFGDHGNDEGDLDTLVKLAGRMGLAERLSVHRMAVQEYLRDNREPFTGMVVFDVLHHIFEDSRNLRSTSRWRELVDFMRLLHAGLAPGGGVLIQETEPVGLRQLATRMGWLKGTVDYSTKQSWRVWAGAASKAGFEVKKRTTYVPFALRRLRPLFCGLPGLYTVSDRSVITLRKPLRE